MTGNYASGLQNAIDALLTFWANEWEIMLNAEGPPDPEFWDALSVDLTIVHELAARARTR